MSLGETIYKLRTEKNLSQGDLAEKLEVSRQSVSKWENNSTVPDLEKIVKLSKLFEVSLDELVKGEVRPAEEQKEVQKEVQEAFPPRKIIGTILFGMAFLLTVIFLALGGGIIGLILAIPFLLCGTICFICKKNVGLWCTWAVYSCLHTYITFGTSISMGSVFYTLHWTAEMNYGRLLFAWILFAVTIALTIVTAAKLRKTGPKDGRKVKKRLLISWLVVICIQVFTMIRPFLPLHKYLLANVLSLGWIYALISLVLECARIIAFTVALTNTARFLFYRKTRQLYED